MALNNADNQAAIATAGGIAPLVVLVQSGTEQQKHDRIRAWLEDDATRRLGIDDTFAFYYLWADFTFRNDAADAPACVPPQKDLLQRSAPVPSRDIVTSCTFLDPMRSVDHCATAADDGRWSERGAPAQWEDLRKMDKASWNRLVRRCRPVHVESPDEQAKPNRAMVRLAAVENMLVESAEVLRHKYAESSSPSSCSWRSDWSAQKLLQLRCPEFAVKIAGVPSDDRRVVLVGDLHGGLFEFWEIVAALTDDSLELTRDIAHVVLLGDLLDRSHHSLELMCLVGALLSKNRERLQIVKRNHETFSQWSTQTGKEIAGHARAFEENGARTMGLLHAFTQCLPVAMFCRIGVRTVQFCHGGVPMRTTKGCAHFLRSRIQCFAALQALLVDGALRNKVCSSYNLSSDVRGLQKTASELLEEAQQYFSLRSTRETINKLRTVVEEKDLRTVGPAHKALARLQQHPAFGARAFANGTRPGVAYEDVVEYCQRLGIHAVYSGHQDFIDVAALADFPGCLSEATYGRAYRNLHSYRRGARRSGEYFVHYPTPKHRPEVLITSAAVAARDYDEDRMRLCYVTLRSAWRVARRRPRGLRSGTPARVTSPL